MNLTNVESVLGSLTVLSVALIPLLGPGAPGAETVVLTAIVVALLQGLLMAVSRARRRRDREESVLEVRRMLQDQVKGQLSRITMAATASGEDVDEEGRLQSEVLGAVDSVTYVVDGLSPESVRTWKQRYSAANSHAMVRRSVETARP
ncbi:MAG TPA: hypothetical protein VK837_02725 [Longimicrobiales bacterium]|nr:hypothetical protein [Longimicrobiales bacterium]